MSWQGRLRGLLLASMCFGVTGCPMVLEDNFKVEPAQAAAASSGGNAGGGQTSNGGKAGTEFYTSGTASDGGEPGVIVTGGTKGQAGAGMLMTDAGAAGLGGDGGATSGEPCADCTVDEKCCNDVCVDVRYDANNCRECGVGCPGTTCDSSSCTNTCAQGFIDCNHNVVDGCEVNPALDPKNCGNCLIECGFQVDCVGGYCICPAGTADCDGDQPNGCETDISSDKASCGACGKSCGANQACTSGNCECEVGFLDCNQLPDDGCEADLTDTQTCGSCELDCGPHTTCVAAQQCGCLTPYLDCDDQAPGCETPITDPQHCGVCDKACPVQSPVCDGSSCSLGCGSLTECNGSCVDTDVDPQNCGGCSKPVGLNQICENGAPVCVTGYDDCDSEPTDCEVNTQTDLAHCGSCGNACKSGALCDAGSCGCAPSTPNDCGATCEKCCDDTQCSDGDSCTADTCNAGVCSSGAECAGGGTCCSGTGCFACCNDDDCAFGKVCSGNQCVDLTCTLPQIPCDSKCVNPSTDAANCGGCGNHCGSGRTCSGSACTPKWVGTKPPLVGFVAREKAAYTALGSKVFVWGGNDGTAKNLADGAIYDPASDSWSAVGSTGTPPSARVLATAVWTGSVVVVWGGGDAANNTDYATGSRYDPATNTWQVMTSVGAPVGRRSPYGFWTGSRVLFYAGVDKSGAAFNGLYLYDPVNDTWATTTTNGRPTGRLDPTIAWTGSLLLLYGGRVGGAATQSTYTYDLAADDWNQVDDGPTSRSGALGTWDGTYLPAWSGTNMGVRNDGKIYDPVSDNWTTMQTQGDPDSRWAPNRQSGWSVRLKPKVTLMVGGYSSITYLTDGGIYNSTTNAWSAVAAWPSGASHLWGVGVWTGTEFVIWGGRQGSNNVLTTSGDRYLP